MLGSHANFQVQELNSFQAYEAPKHKQQLNKSQLPVKLFKCPFDNCNKILRSKKSFNDHYRIHTGQKPYAWLAFDCYSLNLLSTWPGCNKRFIQFSSYQKHQRIHLNEKPYQCQYEGCGKCFSQISNLRRHLRIHTNEKPFYCKICEKFFNTSSNLKQHSEIHKQKLERKTFFCPLCLKQYLYQSNLNKHLRLKRCQNQNLVPSVLNENTIKDLLECNTDSSMDALFLKQCVSPDLKIEKITKDLEPKQINDNNSSQTDNIDQFLSFHNCNLFLNEQEINYDLFHCFSGDIVNGKNS